MQNQKNSKLYQYLYTLFNNLITYDFYYASAKLIHNLTVPSTTSYFLAISLIDIQPSLYSLYAFSLVVFLWCLLTFDLYYYYYPWSNFSSFYDTYTPCAYEYPVD